MDDWPLLPVQLHQLNGVLACAGCLMAIHGGAGTQLRGN
jgi:hypothetical protein